jgi:hypothetical protein
MKSLRVLTFGEDDKSDKYPGSFCLLDQNKKYIPLTDKLQNGKPQILGILKREEGNIDTLIGRDEMDRGALKTKLSLADGIVCSVHSHVQKGRPVSLDYEPTVLVQISTYIPVLYNIKQTHMWQQSDDVVDTYKHPDQRVEILITDDGDVKFKYLPQHFLDHMGNPINKARM